MKFKNKQTGVILEPKSPMVEDQLQKSPDFEAFEEQPAKKPLSKMKVDELLEVAQEAGIEIPEGAKKDDIVDLIKAAGIE